MKKQVGYLAASVILLASSASAQVKFPTTVDSHASSVLVSTNDLLLSSFAANQSYCCTLLPDGAGALAGFSATLHDSSNNSVTGVLRGDVSPAVAVDSTVDSSPADNRVCLLPTTTDTYSMTIASATGGGVSVTPQCEKTSLSGGFNTNGTPFNFLECQNVSESARIIHIFAIDFAGNVLINGNNAGNQFSIGAGLRRDFDIHSSVGASKFGEIRVVQDGPKGAIQCRLSRYESTLEFKGSNSLQ